MLLSLDLGSFIRTLLVLTNADIRAVDKFRPCLAQGDSVEVTRTRTNLCYIRTTGPNSSGLQVALVPSVAEAGPRRAIARTTELLGAALHQQDIESGLLALQDYDAQIALDVMQKV